MDTPFTPSPQSRTPKTVSRRGRILRPSTPYSRNDDTIVPSGRRGATVFARGRREDPEEDSESGMSSNDSGLNFSLDMVPEMDLLDPEDVYLSELSKAYSLSSGPREALFENVVTPASSKGAKRILEFDQESAVADSLSFMQFSVFVEPETPNAEASMTPSVRRGARKQLIMTRGFVQDTPPRPSIPGIPFEIYQDNYDTSQSVVKPAKRTILFTPKGLGITRFYGIDDTRRACLEYRVAIYNIREKTDGTDVLLVTRRKVTGNPEVSISKSKDKCTALFSSREQDRFPAFGERPQGEENMTREELNALRGKPKGRLPIGVVILKKDQLPTQFSLANEAINPVYLLSAYEPLTVVTPGRKKTDVDHIVIELSDPDGVVVSVAVHKNVFSRLMFINSTEITFNDVPVGKERMIRTLTLECKARKKDKLLYVEIMSAEIVVDVGFERPGSDIVHQSSRPLSSSSPGMTPFSRK